MFAFKENTWQKVLTEVMTEELWDLLTSAVLVQMYLAPDCSLLILIVLLCAGDLFRNAEILRFSFPVRAVSSQHPVVCVGEDLLCHWFSWRTGGMGMGGGEEAGVFLRPGYSRRGCSDDTVTNHHL